MAQPQPLTPRPASLLRSLGGIALLDPDTGQPVLGSGKPLALLLYLAATPGRRAGREHLVDLLWANLEPGAARHALRQVVWFLRQRFGEDAILTTDWEFALGLPLDSDRERFLEAVDAGDLDRAVRIYGGEFLPGFALPGGAGFEHWADAQRQQLRLLFQRAAESLARERMGQGRFREARDLARRVRDTDQLDERGWRLLIECCLAADDRVSAFAEVQRLEHTLHEEERDAEPATLALVRRVRAVPEIPGRPDTALVGELVGREREFAALVNAAERARQGTPQVLAVVAPAGLGKTRLLRDVAARVNAAGGQAVYARAQPGDRDVPWSFAADIVHELGGRPGARGIAPASAASLVALDPSLSTALSAPPDASTGDEARRRRYAALADLIQAVAEERPLTLLVDDMHWSDDASRQAIQHAIARLRRSPVVLVLASRGSPFEGVDFHEVIRLDALTREQVEAFLASLGTLPAMPWADDFAARLTVAAGGSPLLLLETLQLAIETGCLRRANGQWEGTDGSALRALLEEGSALSRRIAQLDRVQGWILLLLALAGTPLSLDLLWAASGTSEERTVEDLGALERRGLIARQGGEWAVAHDEIASKAEDHATPAQVVAAHTALGRARLASGHTSGGFRAASRHLLAAPQWSDLAIVAARWVRVQRASGNRGSVRSHVADLLGAAEGSGEVGRVVGSLPLMLRYRRALTTGGVLIAGALLVGALAILAPAHRADTGVMAALWVPGPGGRFRVLAHEITPGELQSKQLSLDVFRPTGIEGLDRAEGVFKPGARYQLATTRTFDDSGGLDVVVVAPGQKVVRLTDPRGDDFGRAWSPDGKYLAIATDRWSQLSHSDLAIIDPGHPDALIRRLTHDPDDRDEVPVWSPDGTRILFLRVRYRDEPKTQLCVVTFDGVGERCLAVPGYHDGSPVGWASPVAVVGTFHDSSGIATILTIDLGSGKSEVVAQGEAPGISYVPGWITCICRRNAAEPYETLLIPLAHKDQAIRVLAGDIPPTLALFPSDQPRTFLDRLAIDSLGRPVPVDGAYRLQLRGWDAGGNPTVPQALQWISSDTSVATVDSLGIVRPRRMGDVLVQASAGGWRTVDARLTIGPPDTHELLDERWERGIDSTWVPFGTPAPFVAQTRRGPAFAPNGDSTQMSGVFTRHPFPVSDGLGVEFDASVPLVGSAPQWQSLVVELVSADSVDWRTWDLPLGELPVNQERWRRCDVISPSGDGVAGASQMMLQAGIDQFPPAPPGLATGRWVRMRLQVFPDGRCGLAVDGKAVALPGRPVPLGRTAMLLIEGRSFHTRILTGRVRVWSGVRSDVDWSAIDRQ